MRVRRKLVGGVVYHVMNRANGRLGIFKKRGDFEAFEGVLAEALEQWTCGLLAYCIMPNHWHMLVMPREDGELSAFMQWLTVTHVRRWHTSHGTVGIGHIYKGPFTSFPVASDGHYLTVVRYIESNAMRAGLVRRSGEWEWSSLGIRLGVEKQGLRLAEGPVKIPGNWRELVDILPNETDLVKLNRALKRGCPFGSESWVDEMAGRLGLEATLRPRGRPKVRHEEEAAKARGADAPGRGKRGRPGKSTYN